MRRVSVPTAQQKSVADRRSEHELRGSRKATTKGEKAGIIVNLRLAKRMGELRASEIREILKVTQQPEVISFAGGLPASELFPVGELAEMAQQVLSQDGRRALQYSSSEGFPSLRHAVAARMNAIRGTSVGGNDVLITSGSQQGLDLTAKIFLDEGDVVLCESPTYLGALNAFKVFRPKFVEVPTDDEGMVVSELEHRLNRLDRIKFIYVVPDFQNPSGRCWSLDRRRCFMEVVSKRKVPVIEDSPYAELCFEGEGLPALKSFDEQNLVVYLSTFSKILSPGLRLAWLVAGPALLRKYVLVKQGTDLHTSSLTQLLVARFLRNCDLDENLRRIRAEYRRRRDAMLAAIDRTFPPGVRITRPRGGLFLWVELPAWCDAAQLLARSLEQNVAFVPGGSFFPNGGHENTCRLNFSHEPCHRIVEGVERLAMILKSLFAAHGAKQRRDTAATAGNNAPHLTRAAEGMRNLGQGR